MGGIWSQRRKRLRTSEDGIAARIAAVLGSAPAPLVAFYEQGDLPRYDDINTLSFEDAEAVTADALSIELFDRLGLWIVEDNGESDPHAYITKRAFSGCVVWMSHEIDPTIRFASLERFVEAMHVAGQHGLDMWDLERDPLSPDGLDSELAALVEEDSEDAASLILIYLSASAPLAHNTKDLLASHSDFFVREALAEWLIGHGSRIDLAIAERLAADSHPQVARASGEAVEAIQSRNPSGGERR